MKKLFCYLALVTLSAMLLCGCSKNNQHSMSGTYVQTNNGTHIIIGDDHEPAIMGNETGDSAIFDNLNNGDKIEISYHAITNTYPSEIQIYSCNKKESGKVDDIPKGLLSKLETFGFGFDF